MTGDNRTITGTGLPIGRDGIESDQVFPEDASPDRAEELLFAGVEGAEYAQDERFRGASVLLVGRDFCRGGSKPAVGRALASWGIEVVVGVSFGEGFVADCCAAGVDTATASEGDLRTVREWVAANPDGKLKVDLDDELLVYGVRTREERDSDAHQPGFAAEEFVQVSVAN